MKQRDRKWTKPFWWFTGGALPVLGADEYMVFDVGGWLEGGQSRWMGRIVLTNARLMHLPMVDRISVPVGRGWRDARTPTTIPLADIESVEPVIVPRGLVSRFIDRQLALTTRSGQRFMFRGGRMKRLERELTQVLAEKSGG